MIHPRSCCVHVLCFVTTTIFFFGGLEDSLTNSPPPPPPPPPPSPPKNPNKSLALLHFLAAFPRTFTYMRVEEASKDYTLPVETLRWKGVESSNIFKGKLFVEEGHYTRHF